MFDALRRLFGTRPGLTVDTVWQKSPEGRRVLVVRARNDGQSAVDVAEVGFALPDGRRFALAGGTPGGDAPPRRLAPGAAVAVAVPDGALDDPLLWSARNTYARTARGDTFTGPPPALG